MKTSILLIALAFIMYSCKQSKNIGTEENAYIEDTLSSVILSPLIEGEYSLSENDFGEVIELKGTSHPVDKIFKVSECEMIALDTLLIMKALQNPEMLMVFTIPSFKFIKSLGRTGNGPGEFRFPKLIKDESGDNLCFILEMTNCNLYALTKDFEIKELPFEIQKTEKTFDSKQLYGVSSKEFFYVESTRNGKAIFHLDIKDDSTNITLLKDLSFSDKHKKWAVDCMEV